MVMGAKSDSSDGDKASRRDGESAGSPNHRGEQQETGNNDGNSNPADDDGRISDAVSLLQERYR